MFAPGSGGGDDNGIVAGWPAVWTGADVVTAAGGGANERLPLELW